MALYSELRNKPVQKKLRTVLISCTLCLFAIVTLFPIYFMIISSFGDAIEAAAANMSLWPRKVSLDSYRFFFNFSRHSYRWLLNSLITSSTATLGNVLFASMAGYAFAKIRFKGRRVIFFTLLCAMMIPYQVTQVPLYILTVNTLQMQNTYQALVLPGLCSVYNVFLCKQFMTSIPTEIIESARIDGCHQPRIFASIILPLSKTILSVMAINTFLANWNTFFWPFLITNTMDMQTIQVGLKNFKFANTMYFSPMMAGATISALPMFILFFSLQKYFLEGVTVGAVKG